MRKIVLLFVAVLAFCASAFAQEEYTNEVETRIKASVSKEFFNALELEFSPQIRLGNDFNYDKTLLDLGLKYDVMGLFKVGAKGRMIFNETKKRGTEITSRLDADISRTFKIDGFRIKPRVRYSHYFNVKNTEGDPSSNLMRYKLAFDYKHSKTALFKPEIGAELYHVLADNSLNALRYSVGGEFRLNDQNSIELFYLLDTDFSDRVLKHIIQLGYKLSF